MYLDTGSGLSFVVVVKIKNCIKIAGLLLATAAVSASAAISDYSGVFQKTISGYKMSTGFTKGGRITGGGFSSVEDADVINPAVSYVRADGTFSGKTLGGNSISGKVVPSGTSYVCKVRVLGTTATMPRTYK